MNCHKGFISPLLLALIALLLIGGGTYVYVQKNQTNQSATTQTSDWKTYTNTQYGYTLNYPEDVLLQPVAEEERLPATESGSIIMGLGGTSGVRVGIYAWVSVPIGVNDVKNPNYEINKGIIENNRIIKLDLKSFSEALRQRAVDDKNSSLPNKNVGGLEEITFAGRTAYAVTVSGYSGGYGFSTGEPFRYIYLDDGNHKFVLQYSLKGDLSKQIIDTFKFISSVTATSTPKNLDSQTASGTPVTLTTIDICSPLLKDASTILFIDNNKKTWTVDYRNASFSGYSRTAGVAQGTDGLLKTTLQDWLKSLYRVGQPQAEICGAPGKITITGTLTDGLVLASHIELAGQ